MAIFLTRRTGEASRAYPPARSQVRGVWERMTTNGSPSLRQTRLSGWSTVCLRLPQFHIGILAEMLDVLFDQRGQRSWLANLDPVVDRAEKAIALRLKRAAGAIDQLEHQHGREMDGFPQVGHQLDVFERIRVCIFQDVGKKLDILLGRIDLLYLLLKIPSYILYQQRTWALQC